MCQFSDLFTVAEPPNLLMVDVRILEHFHEMNVMVLCMRRVVQIDNNTLEALRVKTNVNSLPTETSMWVICVELGFVS